MLNADRVPVSWILILKVLASDISKKQNLRHYNKVCEKCLYLATGLNRQYFDFGMSDFMK